MAGEFDAPGNPGSLPISQIGDCSPIVGDDSLGFGMAVAVEDLRDVGQEVGGVSNY